MPIDVIMPKLGESITEGTILEWKKDVGDKITKDETLLEISTDKVDSEIPSPAEGKIIQILYKVNDVVAVGEVIARIGGDRDSIPKETHSEKKSEIKEIDSEENKSIATVEDSSIINSIPKQDDPTLTRFYSPLVKSIAKKESILLSELETENKREYCIRLMSIPEYQMC